MWSLCPKRRLRHRKNQPACRSQSPCRLRPQSQSCSQLRPRRLRSPIPSICPICVPRAPRPFARDRYVRIDRPTYRGTGMFAMAGVMYGSTLLFQVVDRVWFQEAQGIIERTFLGIGAGFAAAGGVKRGRADAYDDAALGRSPRDADRALRVGATLVGVGGALALVNEAMWWRCVVDGEGPYVKEANDFRRECRQGVNRGMLDVSAAVTTTGIGILTWSLIYRRDAKAYRRARVVGMSPTFGRESVGFTVEGRF